MSTSVSGQFMSAMRQVASPVSLVVSRVSGRPWATTISSFTSISADPPIIMISLITKSAGGASLAEEEVFTVSLLNDHQTELARFGSAPGAAKFLDNQEFALDVVEGGLVVRDSICGMTCDVVRREIVEDHILIFGKVKGIALGSVFRPLLYSQRTFKRLGGDLGNRQCPELDPFFDTLVHAI